MILSSSIRGEVATVEGNGANSIPTVIYAKFKTVYFTTGSEVFRIFLKNTSGQSNTGQYVSNFTNNFLSISPEIRLNSTLGSNDNSSLPYGYDVTIEDTDQSYDIYHDSQEGVVTQSIMDYREFYNGEFIGEDILITDGKLNVPVIKETNASFIAPYDRDWETTPSWLSWYIS